MPHHIDDNNNNNYHYHYHYQNHHDYDNNNNFKSWRILFHCRINYYRLHNINCRNHHCSYYYHHHHHYHYHYHYHGRLHLELVLLDIMEQLLWPKRAHPRAGLSRRLLMLRTTSCIPRGGND